MSDTSEACTRVIASCLKCAFHGSPDVITLVRSSVVVVVSDSVLEILVVSTILFKRDACVMANDLLGRTQIQTKL